MEDVLLISCNPLFHFGDLPVNIFFDYDQVSREERKPGAWKGRVQIVPDFDDLPPEIEKVFKGESD